MVGNVITKAGRPTFALRHINTQPRLAALKRIKPAPRRHRFAQAVPATAAQPLDAILPANDCATILPPRTMKVSVPSSYTLSAVSALHRM